MTILYAFYILLSQYQYCHFYVQISKKKSSHFFFLRNDFFLHFKNFHKIIKSKNVHSIWGSTYLKEICWWKWKKYKKIFFLNPCIKYGEIIHFVIKYLQYDAVNFFYFSYKINSIVFIKNLFNMLDLIKLQTFTIQ